MRPGGALLRRRRGIRQAPACVVAREGRYLLLSMKVRSCGPARSIGATSLIRCESRLGSEDSAPVKETISATVKPDGRSKKRRFPISPSQNSSEILDCKESPAMQAIETWHLPSRWFARVAEDGFGPSSDARSLSRMSCGSRKLWRGRPRLGRERRSLAAPKRDWALCV